MSPRVESVSGGPASGAPRSFGVSRGATRRADRARRSRPRARFPRAAGRGPPSPRDASVPPSHAYLGSRAAPGAPRTGRLASVGRDTVIRVPPGLNLRETPPRGSFGSIRPPRVHAGAGGKRTGGQGQASQYS